MDNKTKQERSSNMSAVHSKNTKPELFVRSTLHKLGYRFRLHKKDIFGNPDIVLPKYKIVIFVDGCFWHGHEGCPKSTLPTSNIEFWEKKLSGNKARDKTVNEVLCAEGWRVLRIWECSVKTIKARATFESDFQKWVKSGATYGELPPKKPNHD